MQKLVFDIETWILLSTVQFQLERDDKTKVEEVRCRRHEHEEHKTKTKIKE
jgi:hypothetical protein